MKDLDAHDIGSTSTNGLGETPEVYFMSGLVVKVRRDAAF